MTLLFLPLTIALPNSPAFMWHVDSLHYIQAAFVMPKLGLYLGQAKLIDFSADFSLTTTKLMPFEDWYWAKIVRYDEFCYSERLGFLDT